MPAHVTLLIPGGAPAPQAVPPRLARIPLQRLEAEGPLASPVSHSLLAQDFRLAKQALLLNLLDPEAVVQRRGLILVTSATAGEGRTFCALNLALSLAAEIDREVLLVDADVVQPRLLERLGLPPRFGLLDLLSGPGLRLDELTVRTDVPHLSLLSSGTPNPLATELLASEAMDRLLRELAASAPRTLVVLDAPPLLHSPASRVLASRVGQVVLVVEAARTPRAAVKEALGLVAACEVVLPLLNKAQPASGRVPLARKARAWIR